MSATTAIAIIACSVVAPGRRSSRNHRLPAGGIYALKPIGKSPAYFKKPDESEKTKTRNPVVNALFGAGAETKARIARLEYELETERAHSSELGLKLRDVEAKVAVLDERLEMYLGRLKEADKDVFKLERQLEEHQKGFDHGMGVAKKQIRRLEEKLEEAKKDAERW